MNTPYPIEWTKGDPAVWRDANGVERDATVTVVENGQVQVRVHDLALVWASPGELSRVRRAA